MAASAGDRRGDRRADHARERDPAVGLDQREAVRQQAGYGGGAGHAVRLGRDEYAERRGIEQRRVVGDRAGEHPAEEGADREGRPDRPAPAVAEPVEERADQRRHDRERQHRQAEEQRHLAARLAGGAGEEDRGRQRDRDGGVAGRVGGVQVDEPGQPGLLGALGAGRALRLADRVAAGPAGHPRHPAQAAAGRLRAGAEALADALRARSPEPGIGSVGPSGAEGISGRSDVMRPSCPLAPTGTPANPRPDTTARR